MQGGKREAVPRDALTGTGGRASTGTTGTSASSSAVNRVDSSGVEPRNSALTTAISSTVVQLAFVRHRDRRRITFSTYRLLAICTRTGAWTRGPPSPDLWIHRIMWNSRVCWEAGRPVSDSSNAASALLWCEFNLLFFFILLFHFVGLLKRREKVLESSSKLWKIFIRGLTLFCLQRQFWKILFSIVFLIVLERGYGERLVLFVLVYLRRKFVEKIEML